MATRHAALHTLRSLTSGLGSLRRNTGFAAGSFWVRSGFVRPDSGFVFDLAPFGIINFLGSFALFLVSRPRHLFAAGSQNTFDHSANATKGALDAERFSLNLQAKRVVTEVSAKVLLREPTQRPAKQARST